MLETAMFLALELPGKNALKEMFPPCCWDHAFGWKCTKTVSADFLG